MAHLAGVLAAEGEAAPYRIEVGALEREIAGQGVGIGEGEVIALVRLEIAPEGWPTVDACVDPAPAEVDFGDRPVHQRFHLQPEQTAQMARPLQVAAHPVQSLGAAREHSVVQHPQVLAAASLAGVHHEASPAQRHTAEGAGHDSGLAAVKYERAQIDVARLGPALHEAGCA